MIDPIRRPPTGPLALPSRGSAPIAEPTAPPKAEIPGSDRGAIRRDRPEATVAPEMRQSRLQLEDFADPFPESGAPLNDLRAATDRILDQMPPRERQQAEAEIAGLFQGVPDLEDSGELGSERLSSQQAYSQALKEEFVAYRASVDEQWDRFFASLGQFLANKQITEALDSAAKQDVLDERLAFAKQLTRDVTASQSQPNGHQSTLLSAHLSEKTI